MDWTGFIPELQLGGIFLLAAYGGRFLQKQFLGYIAVIIVFCMIISLFILTELFDPSLLTGKSNDKMQRYQSMITSMLLRHVPGKERVFLSGSAVFWINVNTDILQVRGDNDTASTHPWWAHGAYQIREGDNAQLSQAWLRILGASYLLVHGSNSEDPFHDFKHVGKFSSARDSGFTLIEKQDDNYLYKVKGAYIARVTSGNLLNTTPPSNGADSAALLSYVSMIKRPAEYRFVKSNQIAISTTTTSDEVISLAVSYDPHWKIIQGKGKISEDAVSNIIITPENQGQQEFILQYQMNMLDWLIPLLATVLFLIIFVRFKQVYPYFHKLFSKFSIGLHAEENDY
jgi:hypothetical protein